MADVDEDPSSGMQSSEEEEETDDVMEEPVESLIRGRAKRSTAGQHMSALIDAAADDDLTLLFQEVEDDNEFADEAEAAGEEDDMALDSSDDDDDQGPNAQNDYEGEQELQKEERKKRRAQNDLRFQTLRKRVKIDPTAVSAVPPPRPKKKSERISWLPTVEDGPTRSSSRRQTMHNKEMTHARLKDSQEKRVRIIATMKEAEKRKAHLRPREMTQEDHLAEAARVERSNSKSLNRWEQTEKRKADERKARIEALQNRRLEGPVISYWSGLATWTNGRLTRVGKADIKVKPEKTESKKQKKEEKPAAALQVAPSAIPGPAPTQPLGTPTNPENPQVPAPTAATDGVVPSDQKATQDAPSSEPTTVPPAPGSAPPNNSEEKASEQQPTADSSVNAEQKPGDAEAQKKPVNPTPPRPVALDSEGKPIPVVEIPAPRRRSASARAKSSTPVPAEGSAQEPVAMDIDKEASKEPSKEPSEKPSKDPAKSDAPESTEQSKPPTPDIPGAPTSNAQAPTVLEQPPPSNSVSSTTGPLPQSVTHPTATPGGTPLGPQASADAVPMQATTPDINAISGPPTGPVSSAATLAGGVNGATVPEDPPPPPVIEHTGRIVTILENFDHSTAHSKKYSMYFNARKPPRLASTPPLYLRNIWTTANRSQKSRHRFV